MTHDCITVNKTKKEYVAVAKVGGEVLVREWVETPDSGIIPYLLGSSKESREAESYLSDPQYRGRWAGDEVYVVMDDEPSGFYKEVRANYTNIFRNVLSEYIALIGGQVRAEKFKPQTV